MGGGTGGWGGLKPLQFSLLLLRIIIFLHTDISNSPPQFLAGSYAYILTW